MKKRVFVVLQVFIMLFVLCSCDTPLITLENVNDSAVQPSPITCKICGEELPANAKFCYECGNPIQLEIVSTNDEIEVSSKEYEIVLDSNADQDIDSVVEDNSKVTDVVDVAIRYQEANELYSYGNYSDALVIYQELGDYEDSLDRVLVCQRQIGMSENADNRFLEALEKSVLDRLKTVHTENYDYKTLVATELAYVEQLANEVFYDSELKNLAEQYVRGLLLQRESLETESKYEHQIEWQEGLVYRFEVLKKLYENYDFMSDNKEFIGNYILQYEDQKALLEAYEVIANDMVGQWNSDDFNCAWNDEDVYLEYNFTLKNNTSYTYGVTFEACFSDCNDIIFERDTVYIGNVSPGESYFVSLTCLSPENASYNPEVGNRSIYVSWSCYYDSIIL